MGVQYDAIASLVKRLAERTAVACEKQDQVIASPLIFINGQPDLFGYRDLITDAQVLIGEDGGLIPNAVSRLRRETQTPVEILTVKLSGSKGNAQVALKTHFGVVVIYNHPTQSVLLAEMSSWGVPPQIKEVEKIVYQNREVRVEVPQPSLWKRLFG